MLPLAILEIVQQVSFLIFSCLLSSKMERFHNAQHSMISYNLKFKFGNFKIKSSVIFIDHVNGKRERL